MDLYIKFIFGIISLYANVVLTFSIFKAPIKWNDKQISVIAVVVGTVGVYLKFVALSNLFIIMQTVVFIVLLSLLRRYPLPYASLVVVTGVIASSLIDAILSISVLQAGIVKGDPSFVNTNHFVYMHIAFSILCLFVAWFLVRNKIGFSFVKRGFLGNFYLKKSTYVWAAILILVVTVLQLGLQNFSLYTMNSLMIFSAATAFIILIIFSYFQNKKALFDRYGEKMKAS